MAEDAQMMPYEVPHQIIELIAETLSEIDVLASEINCLITTLRKTGHNGLVFHDPASGEKIQVLANINEVLMAMLQEASECTHKIRYDPKTGKITQPDMMTCFGISNFSDTAVWGSDESRTLDHNDPKAYAKWQKNLQTDKNKRTFTVGPITGLSNALHLPQKEEDKVCALIVEKLSELTGLKGKLNSQCCHNARIDRYAYEGEKKADEKKAAEAQGIPYVNKANGDESKVHSAIVKLMSEPKGAIRKLADLRVAANRSTMISHLMGLENCFITPYREFLTKDDEPVATWKVETGKGIGGESLSKGEGTFDAVSLGKIWDAVCMMRKYELKPKMHFKEKRNLDVNTPLEDVDKFTHAWRNYAVSKGIQPSHYGSIRICDASGQLVRFTSAQGVTRAPNYKEYAAMNIKSRWQGAVILVTARPNAKDGVYANTETVIMALPSNYIFKLRLAEGKPPMLKLPFNNLLEMMIEFTGNRPNRDIKFIAESEMDMDCVYTTTVEVVSECLALTEAEGANPKRIKNDSPPYSPEPPAEDEE